MWNDACAWTRPRLPLMAGGELTGTDRRKTERHLIGCPDCRDRLESCRGTVDLLRMIASETGPSADAPSLWPSLARQIRETRREPQVLSLWGLRTPGWVGSALAASLLLAVGAGASWTWSRSGTVIAVSPTVSSPAKIVTVPEVSPKKAKANPKSEMPTLVEGPRREDDRASSDPAKAAVRTSNPPATSTKPVVEATH